MRFTFTNNAPVSALVAAGACAVMPVAARLRVADSAVTLASARVRVADRALPVAAPALRVPTPAVVTPVTARPLPMTRQDQSAQNMIKAALVKTAKHGYTPVLETIPSAKLGGFRGVPPRRKSRTR